MATKQALKGINLSEYIGEWVVVSNNKIIAHDKSLAKIQKAIDDCRSTPLVTRIPKSEILIF